MSHLSVARKGIWTSGRRSKTTLAGLAVVALSAWLAVGTPAQGQTPEQKLFEWDTPAFPRDEYQARRGRLLGLLEQTGDVLLVPSGRGLSHGETFRQLDDFSYLVGLELPRSTLILDGAASEIALFVPAGDERFASDSRPNDFPGRPLATDPQIGDWVQDAAIRDAATLEDQVRGLVGRGRRLLINSGGAELPPFPPPLHPTDDVTAAAARSFIERFGQEHFASGFRHMARVRAYKTEREIRTMERAARMTSRAIVRASRSVAPGASERDLEGAFLNACKEDGSQRTAYAPIIKSGPNSLWPWRILASHYDRRDRTMAPGDLVIFDVGCELDGYVSDVGRTFPVSGTFTPEQRRILDMEVDVADAILAAVRPGVRFADLRNIADDAIPDDQEPYMQVGLFFGHHLGLSTGDPVLTDDPLQPGMIFTVEPWYYNHDRDISVFTEDQVLVTETGARVLTADLPRRPAELEALLLNGVVPGLTQDPTQPPPPADLEERVDLYASAWNEPDPVARMAVLESVWAEDGEYRDPSVHLRGPTALATHITVFQAGMPGVAIRRSGPIQRTGALIFFPWEIHDGSGTVLASGKDAGELDVDGRILRIVGFFDRPPGP